MQIERYQTPKGSYIKLLFTQQKEYKYMLDTFIAYEKEIISKGKDSSDVKKIIDALIDGTRPDKEFAVVIIVRPYIYVNLLMAFYEELKNRSSRELYKDMYESGQIVIKSKDDEIAGLQNQIAELKEQLEFKIDEAETTTKLQSYEIKRLRSELKKYTGED